jgi:hypothetical protein
MIEWGQVEARLQSEFGWYRLSEAERAAHPGQAELDGIQTRLDKLVASRDALLPRLPGLPARTADVVALKLAVAAELVDVADHPEANALIRKVREDVLAL